MGTKKISELPASTSLSDDSLFPVVTSGETKKATYELLKESLREDLVDDVDTFFVNGADYGEVGRWWDNNPNGEDRLYRFVTLTGNGRTIKFADSDDQITGVTTDRAGFVGNARDYTESDVTRNIVGIVGVVPVRTNDNTIVANDRVMSDAHGYAIKSTNNLGYRVLSVLERGLLEVVVSPNTDLIQRIKTDLTGVKVATANINGEPVTKITTGSSTRLATTKAVVDYVAEHSACSDSSSTKEELLDIVYTKEQSDERYALKGESGSGIGRKALPILYLYGDMSEMTKDVKVKMPYRWTDADGFADAGHQESGWADVKWQGNTSLLKPKKNFNVTFYKDPWKKNKDKHKYKDGWGKENKYVFKANATDLSQAKNVVGARIWSAMTKSRKSYPSGLSDTANHGAIDGFPCLLYHDGEYLGLYMMTVHKDNMTDLDDKIETNALVAGWNVTHTEIPDAITPIIQNGVSALKTYMNDVTNTFEDIDEYMDKESMIDYIIYTWVFAALDSMSQENFFYMTYDCTKFYMIMYDMDSTFGNNLQGGTEVPYTIPYITAESKGWYNVDDTTRAMLIHFIDVFKAEIIERYNFLRQNILTVDYIMEEVSNIMDAIGDEYKRDNIRWNINGGTFTEWQKKSTFENWIENRFITTDSDIKALNGDYIPCTGLTIDQTDVTTSKSFTITATKTPANASDEIVWQTSNREVATVNNGIVTVVGDGSCVITAICGTQKSTCKVTVNGLITWSDTATYSMDKGVIYETGGNKKLSGKIPVKAGKNYAITWVSGGYSYWSLALYKTDGTPISWSNDMLKNSTRTVYCSIPEAYEDNIYMRIACQWTTTYGGDIVVEVEESDDVWAKSNSAGFGAFAIIDKNTGDIGPVSLVENSSDSNWWAKNGMTYTMHKIPITEGQTVTVKNSSNAAIFFYDSDGNGISGNRGGNFALNDYSLVAPAGSAWCFCESRVPNSKLDTIDVIVS